jgi:chemotaxis protein methyltransferase CheR
VPSVASVFPDELALSDRDLSRIVKLVYERSGITLHDGKRALVMARLQKRLRHHGFTSFSEYIKYVEADTAGEELVALLDAIATNHTYFFREAQHFAFLADRAVRDYQARGAQAPFRVWSNPCSTGEEPYSIAMTLDRVAPAVDYSLLASDMSTKALKAAREGVYKMAGVQALPKDVLRRYFERGLGAQEGLARVSADLRKRVTFRHLNLLEIGDLHETFDVVFCRNVMIYFDKPVQQRVIAMLERHVTPGGYLFISHSESLNGLTHSLRWVAPAIYQRGARD